MESFTIFTSSVLPLSMTTWLGMTWSCILGTEIQFELNKILFMRKNFSTSRLPVGCTGSYTTDEPNFPLWNTGNLIWQKTVWQGIEFWGLFKI